MSAQARFAEEIAAGERALGPQMQAANAIVIVTVTAAAMQAQAGRAGVVCRITEGGAVSDDEKRP